MVKRLLKWTDKKYEEIDVYNDKHPYLKSAGLGFLEGVIDGAVIAYPMLLISCIWLRKQLDKKED